MRALFQPLLSRPLAQLALGLALGLAWEGGGPAWPAFALPLALGFFLLWRRLDIYALPCLLVSGLLLGAWRGAALDALLAKAPAPGHDAVRAEGLVAEDLGTKEESGRRALVLEQVELEDLLGPKGKRQKLQGRLRLSFEATEPPLEFFPGDRVAFEGSLRSPSPPTNPGEFNYRGYLLGRGMEWLAYPRPKTLPQRKAEGGPGLRRLAAQARWQLVQGLSRFLSERSAALARGMILGDTGALTREDSSRYARTGLVHILSVSGMHLVLLLAAFGWLLEKAGASRRARAWAGLALGVSYAFVCGMPIPCLRALCLFAPFMLAQALDLESDALNSLSFGALLALLIQPGALFEAGAQLSFVVSLTLMTLGPRLMDSFPEKWPRWLKMALAGSLAAEAGALPLVAWHFSVFSWPSLFATALTAPLMAPIISLGLLCALLGWLAPALAPLAAYPLEAMLGLLDYATTLMASLPASAISTGRPSSTWLAVWALFCFALALSHSRQRLLALPFLLLALFWPALPFAHRHAGETRAWFFDVGQGDAIFVEFGDGKTLLVDAGPYKPDAGSWVVGPALRRLGVNRIDWAVATHPHADHIGGLVWMLREFSVGALLHSGEKHKSAIWPMVEKLAKNSVDLSKMPPPPGWEGRIRSLSPRKARMKGTKHDLHNNNVALEVEGWLLLPGDMHSEGERRLAAAGLKQGGLLKVGHHGSKSSSSAAFLKALRPSHAVIQCGRRNLYRHPSPDALSRLGRAGAALHRSDLEGCIEVGRTAEGIRFKPWREVEMAALWQAPPKRQRSLWKTLEKAGRIAPIRAREEDEAEL